MEDSNQPYRTLNFLVKYGDWLAPTVGWGTLILGVILALAGWFWAVPLAAFAAAFLYLIMRSYVELVRVIVDMLLPK